MIHNVYRYEDAFQDSKKALQVFSDIPFLNVGLFECLDKTVGTKEKPEHIRIDGFSDRDDNPLAVPDFLFFGDEREVDLSAAYGEARFKRAKVRGLIHTFYRYKFTITENTPIEEEIALDPELAGKVFENLLAAYNPETSTTARKQTGSFFTPREIVNYMVDEALIAYLSEKVGQTFLSGSGSAVPDEIQKTHRHLPHWTKTGSIYWITFRLVDALPQEKLQVWKQERDLWLQQHPQPFSDADWKEYDDRFGRKLEEWLDAGMGSRALARPDVRDAVRQCLTRFDGDRLRLHAAVSMPTHVHALIEPLGSHTLSELMKGIKGASARAANQILSASGPFWLDESYDHIVRSEAQYQRFLQYIVENPVKARLQQDEYWIHQAVATVNESPQKTPDKNVWPTLEARLRHLFAYNDEPHKFTAQEVDALIAAIDSLKSLDPACGSGAFPMGMLHKLVFILGKLDPRNEQWEKRQISRVKDVIKAAEKIEDAAIRERTLKDLEQQIENIEEAFERNELDYGRKLYLIENCIYGVDIQPIAVQIAKMRFFISLIVDQKVIKGGTGIPACDASKERQTRMSVPPWNQGGTGIPACDASKERQTRMSAPPWNQGGTGIPACDASKERRIDDKEAELRQVRERHFAARTPATKARCRDLDAKLRAEIAELLKSDGWNDKAARQLAAWDPYDQNASADFFDSEWMFGITDGFDVSIGAHPDAHANGRRAGGLVERSLRQRP